MVERRVPVDAVFGDATAETGGLILFLSNGRLDELEVWSAGDPAPMPDASILRVSKLGD